MLLIFLSWTILIFYEMVTSTCVTAEVVQPLHSAENVSRRLAQDLGSW